MSDKDKGMGIVVSDLPIRVESGSTATHRWKIWWSGVMSHRGQKRRFFGMITEVVLGVTDLNLTQTPPDTNDPFIAEVLSGTSTYGSLQVMPYLTIGGDVASVVEGPQPVKTVPSHYSAVNLAEDRDIELVFGKEDKERFWIGNPLDMETKLCINLPELVKRSNGIFGKSGTGKTFLTRMLLIGMLQKAPASIWFSICTANTAGPAAAKGAQRQSLKAIIPFQGGGFYAGRGKLAQPRRQHVTW